MKKGLIKATSLVLALATALLCALPSLTAFAAQDELIPTSDGHYSSAQYPNMLFDLNTRTGELNLFLCFDMFAEEITLPSAIAGHPLTSIGWRSFLRCNHMGKLSVPKTVKAIGDEAFYNLEKFAWIEFEEGTQLLDIGENAFYNTAFYNYSGNWDGNLFYLGEYLLSSKQNTEGVIDNLIIREGTTCIAAGAIEAVYYASLTLPDSLAAISHKGFSEFYSVCREIFVPDSVTYIGSNAFDSRRNLERVRLSRNVQSLGYGTFYGCRALTEIDFGDNSKLTSLGDSCFENCISLEAIELPDTITVIGENCFKGCTSLTDIGLPRNKNAKYKSGILENCTSLKSVTIPREWSIIPSSMFCGCTSLEAIEVPTGIIIIDTEAFSDCIGLTYVRFFEGSKLDIIGDGAFSHCSSLKHITFPDSVSSLGGYLFQNSGIESLEFPPKITDCSEILFSANCLKNLVIPNGQTMIGRDSLGNLDVETVYIPVSVKEICKNAFGKSYADEENGGYYRTWKLADIYYEGNAEQWNKLVIGDGNEGIGNATIHYNSKRCAHNWGSAAVTQKATTVENGSKEYTCSLCGEKKTVFLERLTAQQAVDDIFSGESTLIFGKPMTLTADVYALPGAARVSWSVKGDAVSISPSADGMTCKVESVSNGSATVIATVYDKDGRQLEIDGILAEKKLEISSKAGFIYKLLAFFRKLFRLNYTLSAI